MLKYCVYFPSQSYNAFEGGRTADDGGKGRLQNTGF
jgi:hypothetical protein